MSLYPSPTTLRSPPLDRSTRELIGLSNALLGAARPSRKRPRNRRGQPARWELGAAPPAVLGRGPRGMPGLAPLSDEGNPEIDDLHLVC